MSRFLPLQRNDCFKLKSVVQLWRDPVFHLRLKMPCAELYGPFDGTAGWPENGNGTECRLVDSLGAIVEVPCRVMWILMSHAL